MQMPQTVEADHPFVMSHEAPLKVEKLFIWAVVLGVPRALALVLLPVDSLSQNELVTVRPV